MSTKEKNITAMFSELNSILNDCNKTLADNVELKKELAWYKDYADRLVEHKDMVCLPADLKNLRESNATLATENQELKKLIMDNWYTHKQDTEMTKTFMAKQVMPIDIEFDSRDW